MSIPSDDKGALQIKIGHKDGMVGMFFDDPTTWMMMTPAQAESIAASLIDSATKARGDVS